MRRETQLAQSARFHGRKFGTRRWPSEVRMPYYLSQKHAIDDSILRVLQHVLKLADPGYAELLEQ